MSEDIFNVLLKENGFDEKDNGIYIKFWDNNDLQVDGNLTFKDIKILFIAMNAIRTIGEASQ